MELKRKAFRIAWATLLRKVWDVDSMACPRCFSKMEIVAAITSLPVVERILKHVGLFDQSRASSIYNCPTPPIAADGQTLFVFPQRSGSRDTAAPSPVREHPTVSRTRTKTGSTPIRWNSSTPEVAQPAPPG